MSSRLRLVFFCMETLFLAGVAFLIIRDNSYPWYVKRFSDIVFLGLIPATIAFLLKHKELGAFWKGLKDMRLGLALFWAGIMLATIIGYATEKKGVNTDAALAFFRIAVDMSLLWLCGFFYRYDERFIIKTAFAQLSTIAYIPMLFTPQNDPATVMPRFQLFENFPSNVGYYLIISITFILVYAVMEKENSKKGALLCAALPFLSGIFVWTQSRASVVGIGVMFIAGCLLLWNYFPWRIMRIAKFGLLFILSLILGCFLLPKPIQNIVLGRYFPALNADNKISKSYATLQPDQLVKEVAQKHITLDVRDSSRISLWKTFSARLFTHPLGQGPAYTPVMYDGSLRGPHNTILELLLMGGPLTLAGVLLLLWKAVSKVRHAFATNTQKIPAAYLALSLSGILTATLFDNMSSFRVLWLLIGLALCLAGPATKVARKVELSQTVTEKLTL